MNSTVLLVAGSTPTSRVSEKWGSIADNDTNANHLVRTLRKTGQYSPKRTTYKAHRIALDAHVVLLDVVMPIRDGGEFAPELQNTPIIFLTTLVTPTEAKAGVHIDGHPFLAKPVNIQELIGAIDENLTARANAIG